ncbi:MAG TPA: gliding motility-associated C-terminal domain-containing protein, partial [Chitinophagales bacterium]|nr:gliding motility-associated C-terminal domain-containing protein [Chitinophagales bacterium]
LSVDSAGKVVFAHSVNQCGTDVYEYVVCNYGECDTAIIRITVNCPDNIFLPQGFSPNGDGKNDLLVFPGLLYFSPALLKVFNRYGTIVYESDDYQNDWDGTGMDTHNPLPDGAYYYVLQPNNGKTYNNYLVINR